MLLNTGGFSNMTFLVNKAQSNPLRRKLFGNAMAFSQKTSIPQGYTSPYVALVSPIQTTGEIASRQIIETFFTAELGGIGGLTAQADIDINFDSFGNVLGNITAAFPIEINMTAILAAQGNLSALIDWSARPSAFDIAQETLNALASQYNNPITIGGKINAAAAGGGGGGGGVILNSGFVVSASSTEITIDAAAESTENIYVFNKIVITSGTGSGQLRKIKNYRGSSKTVFIDIPWFVIPDGTSEYSIVP